MKVLAILLSPITSISVIWFIISILTINSKSDDWGDNFFFYFLICSVAIGAQLFVEFLLLIIELWTQITFEIYLNLATVICVIIGFLTFFFISDNSNSYINLSNSVISFLSFFIYSIGNAFTYNYLYFSKLDKEMNSPVIPTKEGTEFKIDEV